MKKIFLFLFLMNLFAVVYSSNTCVLEFPVLKSAKENLSEGVKVALDTCIYIIEKENFTHRENFYILFYQIEYCEGDSIVFSMDYRELDTGEEFFGVYRTVEGIFPYRGYNCLIYPKKYSSPLCEHKNDFAKTSDSIEVTFLYVGECSMEEITIYFNQKGKDFIIEKVELSLSGEIYSRFLDY